MRRKSQWENMLKGYAAARELVSAAAAADPTPTRAYVTWILRQFRAGEVRLPDDGPSVRRLLVGWERVKGRPAFTGTRDINRYSYRLLEGLVREASGQASERERLVQAKREGAEQVSAAGRYRALKVTTPAAASAYARATRWCTAEMRLAAGYLAQGPLFVILRDGHTYAQAHPATCELRDTADRPLRPDADLTAALLAVNAPDEFFFSRRREARRCYRKRDFTTLCDLLRSFAGMSLLSVPLSYLSDAWIRLLWQIFRVGRASWAWLKAGRPGEPGWAYTEWWQAMAFLVELRQERTRRPRNPAWLDPRGYPEQTGHPAYAW
jgi:hypothetical protein